MKNILIYSLDDFAFDCITAINDGSNQIVIEAHKKNFKSPEIHITSNDGSIFKTKLQVVNNFVIYEIPHDHYNNNGIIRIVIVDGDYQSKELTITGITFDESKVLTVESVSEIEFVCKAKAISAGAAGPQGPKGEKGDTGAAGPQGPKGEKGDTGAAGPQGLKGEKGDTGAAGPQGPKGEKGDTGAAGPQGLKGEKGDTGAAGPQGPKGEKGDTGAAGPQGLKGEKGDTGAAGPQGPKGEKGDTGAAGPQGPKGEKGDSVVNKTLKVTLASSGWSLNGNDGYYYQECTASGITTNNNIIVDTDDPEIKCITQAANSLAFRSIRKKNAIAKVMIFG